MKKLLLTAGAIGVLLSGCGSSAQPPLGYFSQNKPVEKLDSGIKIAENLFLFHTEATSNDPTYPLVQKCRMDGGKIDNLTHFTPGADFLDDVLKNEINKEYINEDTRVSICHDQNLSNPKFLLFTNSFATGKTKDKSIHTRTGTNRGGVTKSTTFIPGGKTITTATILVDSTGTMKQMWAKKYEKDSSKFNEYEKAFK